MQTKFIKIILIVLILFFGFNFSNSSVKAFLGDLTWVAKTNMPTARYELRAVTASNGRIYAMGGHSNVGLVATVEEYNPSTDTWATRASMPTARQGLGLAAANNGKIYAIGGQTPNGSIVATVEAYDPGTDTWTTVSNMPTEKIDFATVAASNGKIYVIGGVTTPSTILATVEAYDPGTDTWTTVSNMPTARYGLEAAEGGNGKIYAIGGNPGSGAINAYTVEAYNPSTDTWSAVQRMPTPRSALGVVTANGGKIYAIGGVTPNVTGVAEEYDPISNTWATVSSMLTPRAAQGLSVGNNGKIYAIGGLNSDFSIINSVEEATILVPNNPPSINSISNDILNEGDSYSANGSFTDPDSTAWTATVDYGDGFGSQPLTLSGNNFNLSHVYQDNGSYTVTVAVTDNQGATGKGTTTVTVNNTPPTVGTITVVTSPAQINNPIIASANFTDPGVLDTHTAFWDWGDGNTATGTVTEANGSGSVSDSHTYTAAGVYTITLTVTDKDSGSGVSTYQYVAVYDPSAGFLTGSGKYDSLPGWDIQDPQAQGEVKFETNALYETGSQVPSGQTKVKFKLANLDFSSNSSQWLVVSGSKMTLRGTGTINRSGNYNFILIGIDGSQTGGLSLIRLQITDSSNQVIYDTQPSTPITAELTTPLTSGNIKIH